jgi:hypothetical protein
MNDVHAPGIGEHALCGLAYDAHLSGDTDDPVIFAARGQVVTCEYCRAVIADIRRSYRGFRYLGGADDQTAKSPLARAF